MRVNKCFHLELLALLMLVSGHACATEEHVRADWFDINQESIRTTDVCLEVEGRLESELYITIRVPTNTRNSDFDHYLVLTRNDDAEITGVESRPSVANGLHEIRLSITRFDDRIDDIEIQAIYNGAASIPLIYSIDLDSFFMPIGELDSALEIAQTRINCR